MLVLQDVSDQATAQNTVQILGSCMWLWHSVCVVIKRPTFASCRSLGGTAEAAWQRSDLISKCITFEFPSGRSLGGTAEADADAAQLAGLAAGAVEVFGLQKVFGPSWTRCDDRLPLTSRSPCSSAAGCIWCWQAFTAAHAYLHQHLTA